MVNLNHAISYASVRYIVFREGDVWYGVCIELNIVEQGSTSQEAFLLLFEAVQGYSEAARRARMPSLLRQKTDSEYEKMWQDAAQGISKKQSSKHVIFTFGRLAVAPSRKERSLVST